MHLPTHYRIHDVFNVARLEKYTGRPNQEDNYQAPIIIDDEEQWEVEEVVDKRKRKGELWYKVK